MIGKIKGKFSELNGNIGLIETVGGIFYEIYLTPKLVSIFKQGKDVELYTYLQIREDSQILFGFETKKEHDFFKLLLTVSGVGPKTAFSVISFFPADELVSGIKNNDVDILTQVPGLGRKTAMKIILELSEKLKSEFDMKNIIYSEDDKTVIEALMSLGYKASEAKNILSKLPKNLSVEEKIKRALVFK